MVMEPTVRDNMTSLAMAVMVTRPYFSIMELGKGLRCYPDLFKGITEEVIMDLFSSQVPQHAVIVDAMEALFLTGLGTGHLRVLEERAFLFLETSIIRLSNEDLVKLLKFWTASNVWMGLTAGGL